MTLSRPISRLDGYAPIARAIDYLVANAEAAPSLEEAADVVGLSPTHFQRVFKEGRASRRSASCNSSRQAKRDGR